MIVAQETAVHHGEDRLECVLFHKDAPGGVRPGVLILPEAWGLNDHNLRRARKLAGLGYTVLAGDLYGDRRLYDDIGEAVAHIERLRSDPHDFRKRLGALLDHLADSAFSRSDDLAAIGYCIGGTAALELARSRDDLKAAVSFHGGPDTPLPAAPGQLKARILYCVGAADPLIPATQIDGFIAEMTASGAAWDMMMLGGVGHSFTNPAADGTLEGVFYDKHADDLTWAVMTKHLIMVFS